jgi:hypothetical protein
MEKHVEALIEAAAKAEKSEDAMRFSQAACNAANAMCALASEKTIKASMLIRLPHTNDGTY